MTFHLTAGGGDAPKTFSSVPAKVREKKTEEGCKTVSMNANSGGKLYGMSWFGILRVLHNWHALCERLWESEG